MIFQNIIKNYRTTSDLNRFIVKGGVLYLLWRVFRKWMILKGQYSDFTDVWATVYLRIARFVLTIFGYETSVNYPLCKLWITGADEAIEVVYDCLGVNLFFIFMVFIIAYPGRLLTRLWFVPAGFVLIFLLNAFRMAALTVIVAKTPHLMDLYHHFIFQGVIYLFIFLLWWIFSSISNKLK